MLCSLESEIWPKPTHTGVGLGGSSRKPTPVCLGFQTKRDSTLYGLIYVDVRNPCTPTRVWWVQLETHAGVRGFSDKERFGSLWPDLCQRRWFPAKFGDGRQRNLAVDGVEQVVGLKPIGLFK
jgi:hypothetical protein